jgi:hypothetical protein
MSKVKEHLLYATASCHEDSLFFLYVLLQRKNFFCNRTILTQMFFLNLVFTKPTIFLAIFIETANHHKERHVVREASAGMFMGVLP